MEGPNQCAGNHVVSADTQRQELKVIRRKREKTRKAGLTYLKPSSARPRAVWGNGMWGSVGGAGRFYDLEGLMQLCLSKPHSPCISVTTVTVVSDPRHARRQLLITNSGAPFLAFFARSGDFDSRFFILPIAVYTFPAVPRVDIHPLAHYRCRRHEYRQSDPPV
jgi:hypothetical protein